MKPGAAQRALIEMEKPIGDANVLSRLGQILVQSADTSIVKTEEDAAAAVKNGYKVVAFTENDYDAICWLFYEIGTAASHIKREFDEAYR